MPFTRFYLLFSVLATWLFLASSVVEGGSGRCGPEFGNRICSGMGECCSKWGHCGLPEENEKYCTLGCFSIFSHPGSDCVGLKPLLIPAVERRDIIHSCEIPGMLAVTFDDGPHENTGPILRNFTAAGKDVSFFINGVNLQKSTVFPEYLKAMKKANYTIGNHLYDHVRTSTLDKKMLARELCLNDKAISDVIGVAPIFFRPPFRVLPQEHLNWIIDWGYIVVNFNLNPQDWKHQNAIMSLAKFEAVLGGTDPTTRSYISNQHDSEWCNQEVIPELLDAPYLERWNLVTVGDCVGLPDPESWYREFPWGKLPGFDACD